MFFTSYSVSAPATDQAAARQHFIAKRCIYG